MLGLIRLIVLSLIGYPDRNSLTPLLFLIKLPA